MLMVGSFVHPKLDCFGDLVIAQVQKLHKRKVQKLHIIVEPVAFTGGGLSHFRQVERLDGGEVPGLV